MCLELSVIRNIRPSMPCCTDSTGTPSFPEEGKVIRNLEDFMWRRNVVCVNSDIDWNCLYPLKPELDSQEHCFLVNTSFSAVQVHCYSAPLPLWVWLVLAVIRYCFQEVGVELSGLYWVLRFLLAAPSYILGLVPLFSNSSAIRPNSTTTVNLRKTKHESVLKLVLSERVSDAIDGSWAGRCC